MNSKDIILEYIIEQFGEKTSENYRHYSYCKFPEDECICNNLNKISYDTPLISGGYVDSFSMMIVLIFIEKTFKIKIPDIDTQPSNFNTINDMNDLVLKYSK